MWIFARRPKPNPCVCPIHRQLRCSKKKSASPRNFFSETQIEDQRLGYHSDTSVPSSSVPPSVPLTRIPSIGIDQSETPIRNRPVITAPITIGQIIQETEASRKHLLGRPSTSGLNGHGLDEHDQIRQSVLPNHYSESSDQIRSETINTDQNENTSQPTLNLHLPGASSQYNAGSMDETPRSPDSGQIAFQKRIQDTLISTAERQLESFRNQNHLQFRNIRNFVTVDGTLKE